MQALDVGYAAVGIKHQDLRVRNIRKALKRRFARIAGGGDEDADLSLLAAFFQRGGQQMRQHLQRHILERAGRPVPELQKTGILIEYMNGRDLRIVKVLTVSGHGKAFQLLRRELRQEHAHDLGRSAAVVHLLQSDQFILGQSGKRIGNIESAVRRKTSGDCLGGGGLKAGSCAEILHCCIPHSNAFS